jgi:hypothetical protein
MRFLAVLVFIVVLKPVSAQSADASASPSPSPSTSPRGFAISVDAHTTFITEGTRGPGISPPEGPGFAAGSPLSPLTPYDVFSSAPLTPGNASESAVYFRPSFATPGLIFSATLGAGYVIGSATTASYWGEPLFDTLNPHLGFQQIGFHIAFPTHAGQDDGTGFAASVLSGSVGTSDGRVLVRGGWFDLQQSDSFVFMQPAVTNFRACDLICNCRKRSVAVHQVSIGGKLPTGFCRCAASTASSSKVWEPSS